MKRGYALALFILAIAPFLDGSSWTKQSGGGGVAVDGSITGSVAKCVLHTNADGATLGCEAGFEYDPATNILTVPSIVLTTSIVSPIFSSNAADPADSAVGYNGGNTENLLCAESSPAGTDRCISLNAAEDWLLTPAARIFNLLGIVTSTNTDFTIYENTDARWRFAFSVVGADPFTPVNHNLNDIGLTGTRVRTGYFGTSVDSAAYVTQTNCSDSAGDAACTAAPAGSVVVDAAATETVVSTTAVTANSQIFLQIDASLGTRLGITCNTQSASVFNPRVTARTAATSFTITVDAGPTTDPLCLSYFIVN